MLTVNPWVLDVLAWWQAILAQWIGLVGGAVVAVAFLIYERLYSRQPLSARWLIAGFWVAFVIANFLAWQEQRADVDTANQSLGAERFQNFQLQAQINNETVPNLQASIQEVWAFSRGVNSGLIILLVDLRNLGAPSIADYWAVYIKDKKGNTLQLPLVRSATPFAFQTTTTSMSYKPAYWLPDRTLPNPVPRGGDVKGLLLSVFSRLSVKDVDLSSVRVTFNDVNGQTHDGMSVKYLVNGPAMYPPTLDQ